MEENPELQGCDDEKWEKHFLFHMNAQEQQTKKKTAENEELQNQLVKLQLAQAREIASDKKKTAKNMAQVETPTVMPLQSLTPSVPYHTGYTPISLGQQMIMTSPLIPPTQAVTATVQTPQFAPQAPQYAPQTPQYAPQAPQYYQQPYKGGGGRGRGRGGGYDPNKIKVCLICRAPGHWVQQCPYNSLASQQQQQSQGAGQQGGQPQEGLPNRQAQAPNPQLAPGGWTPPPATGWGQYPQ